LGTNSPAGWVEEQTLGTKRIRFAWTLDARGGVAIRIGTTPPVSRRFPRQDMERLQEFMADHAWHPATQHTEAAFGPKAHRSIEDFGRAELGWDIRCARMAPHLAALLAHSGLWDWNEKQKGMEFRLAEHGLDALRAYYTRRRAGEARPSLERHPKLTRRPAPGPAFDLAVGFRGLSRALRGRFEACLGGRHAAEKGQRREMALIELLRTHLPARYGVTRGEVIASTAECSNQADVLIYDALTSPTLLATDTSCLLAVESVYAAIEVKPRLRVGDLKKAAANLRSIKAFPRTALLRPYAPDASDRGQPESNPPVFGAIFAIESDPPARLLQALDDIQRPLDPALWVDCICILDQAVLYRVGAGTSSPGWTSDFGQRPHTRIARTGLDALLFFYLTLLQDINTKTLLPPDLTHYWQPG